MFWKKTELTIRNIINKILFSLFETHNKVKKVLIALVLLIPSTLNAQNHSSNELPLNLVPQKHIAYQQDSITELINVQFSYQTSDSNKQPTFTAEPFQLTKMPRPRIINKTEQNIQLAQNINIDELIEQQDHILEKLKPVENDFNQSRPRKIGAVPVEVSFEATKLGDVFSDHSLDDPFTVPAKVLKEISPDLKKYSLTTASINTEQNKQKNPAKMDLTEVMEQLIFSPVKNISGDEIITGSINTPMQPQRNSLSYEVGIDNFITGSISDNKNIQTAQVLNAQDSDGNVPLRMKLKLSNDGKTLTGNVTWRIFSAQANAFGEADLIQRIDSPNLNISLPAGNYIVHAAYGLASAHKAIVLALGRPLDDEMLIDVGSLKLTIRHVNMVDFDPSKAHFDIYAVNDPNQIRSGNDTQPLITGVKNDQIIRLNAGDYRIVSHYGNENSQLETFTRVEQGKMINVEVMHESGAVTLKLVSERNGAPMANTEWVIIGPSGDVVAEGYGTLSHHDLSLGEYTTVATNQGESYAQAFNVTLGGEQIVEVLAK